MTQRSPLAGLASDAPPASEPIIEITEAALAKLVELRAEESDADELGLRLEVVSRPGEDFRYELGFEEFLSAAFTDEVRTHTGSGQSPGETALKVMIPGKDVDSLSGATLDFTESQGLVIRNPNRPAAPDIDGLISDDELSAQVRELVAHEVNPALAVHGGFVTYVGHNGEGTAYMTMGGGCHGCSMSRMTMLDGVQTMLAESVPEITAVKDLTDHATGENPYYT